ncbi:uncharacterized protein LOC141658148 [Silene latifolia]|uniref:uncharacterized protein LOC141658148 n=1 Tax=Silene latifolia TaxID=37657 RepID=UPI003D775CD8
MEVTGTKMFRVVTKLKHLKQHLRQFNKDYFVDIEKTTPIALKNLEYVQISISTNSTDVYWLDKEKEALQEYKELKHAFITIKDKYGVEYVDPQGIQDAFLEYYKDLLSTSETTTPINQIIIRQGKICNAEHWTALLRFVTKDDIKAVIFSIPNHKAPGPDGYNSAFYKASLGVIGEEVCEAVLNVIQFGKILKQLNTTILTLVPKCQMPTSVTRFRPIACCNVLYKCISKLLCTRLASMLPDLISLNQGGFIKGRSIIENILVYQDLVRLYNRSGYSPRCMFKMDLIKAYDPVRDQIKEGFQGNEWMVGNETYSVKGCYYWLRSPRPTVVWYRNALRLKDKLDQLGIAPDNLCCLCFIYAEVQEGVSSIMLVVRVLATFSATLGLSVNASKSKVVFNGVADCLKQDIVQVSGFFEGKLPFKYLGVPIQPGRLSRMDYNILIERIVTKIRGIEAKKLSYAGRIILINVVINILHNYWASIFLIPKGVVKRIEIHALNTRIKLYRLGLSMTDRCVLCESYEESVAHLFSDCAFSSKITAGLDKWLLLHISGPYTGYSKLQRKVYRMVKMAYWSAVWRKRNVCRLEFKVRIPEKIINGIVQQMRVRLVQNIGNTSRLGDRDWLRLINISL